MRHGARHGRGADRGAAVPRRCARNSSVFSHGVRFTRGFARFSSGTGSSPSRAGRLGMRCAHRAVALVVGRLPRVRLFGAARLAAASCSFGNAAMASIETIGIHAVPHGPRDVNVATCSRIAPSRAAAAE